MLSITEDKILMPRMEVTKPIANITPTISSKRPNSSKHRHRLPELLRLLLVMPLHHRLPQALHRERVADRTMR